MIKMKNKLMDDFFILPTLNGVYFVTGTDTEIGKTTITAQLVRQRATAGQRVYAIKPVTAGLEDGVSRDAQQINRFANLAPPLAAIAPVRLATPCSPHIAAARDGVQLTTDALIDAVQTTVANYPADVVLVEGAGGWFTPINATATLADVAAGLGYPVVLVVGVKLGCLNHALLSVQAIWQAGLRLALVVFNQLADDTAFAHEQVAWLRAAIMRQAQCAQAKPPQFYWHEFLPHTL